MCGYYVITGGTGTEECNNTSLFSSQASRSERIGFADDAPFLSPFSPQVDFYFLLPPLLLVRGLNELLDWR